MNNTNKTRTINTTFYGDYAAEIINAVAGQLSDGLWENSRGYDKYWTNFSVKRLDDNRVVFIVNTDSYTRYCGRFLENPFCRMTDTEFLAWYAGKLKAVIRAEAKDNNWKKGWWKRNNTTNKSIYLNYKLDITVADIYCVYDELLGRKSRADKEIYNRILGQKADDATIAKRTEFAEAKEKALAEYNKHIAMLDEKLKKFTAEINADKQQAHKIYCAVLDNLKTKYEIA